MVTRIHFPFRNTETNIKKVTVSNDTMSAGMFTLQISSPPCSRLEVDFPVELRNYKKIRDVIGWCSTFPLAANEGLQSASRRPGQAHPMKYTSSVPPLSDELFEVEIFNHLYPCLSISRPLLLSRSCRYSQKDLINGLRLLFVTTPCYGRQ